MLPYHALSMNEKEIIVSTVKDLGFKLSEMNFASMYMWKDAYRTSIARLGKAVIILEKPPLGLPEHILPPLTAGPVKDALLAAAEDFRERGVPFEIRSVDGTRKAAIEAELPGMFDFQPDRDYFDYVYMTKSLIDLSGKALHQKRNHVNKFHSLYRGEFVELRENDAGTCLEVLDKWSRDKGRTELLAHKLERGAVKTALENLSALELRCGAIRVDGRIEAFSIGEKVGDTAFIHIEKANADIQGLFSVINQQFLANAFPDTTYANREEDMGIPGLRQAKSSYKPDHFVEKYIARLIGEGKA